MHRCTETGKHSWKHFLIRRVQFEQWWYGWMKTKSDSERFGAHCSVTLLRLTDAWSQSDGNETKESAYVAITVNIKNRHKHTKTCPWLKNRPTLTEDKLNPTSLSFHADFSSHLSLRLEPWPQCPPQCPSQPSPTHPISWTGFTDDSHRRIW